LLSIQYLRAIAALMVVFHHVLNQYDGFLRILPTQSFAAGVDIFFVISGFVMVFVTATSKRSACQFISMRIVRIVPVYWFYTLMAAALLLVAPRLFNANELSLRHLLLSMCFIPHRFGAAGSLTPLVKQAWTLNYEMFFYLLFAAAIAVSRRWRVLLSIYLLAASAITGFLSDPIGLNPWLQNHPSFAFFTHSIILEFAMGMTIAVAFLQGKLRFLNRKTATFLVIAGCSAIFANGASGAELRVLCYGIPATSIVVGALVLEVRGTFGRQSGLLLLGNASYSIYLVHVFVIAVLRWAWNLRHFRADGVLNLFLFATLSLVLAASLGILSYLAIEKPSLKCLRGLLVAGAMSRP